MVVYICQSGNLYLYLNKCTNLMDWNIQTGKVFQLTEQFEEIHTYNHIGISLRILSGAYVLIITTCL